VLTNSTLYKAHTSIQYTIQKVIPPCFLWATFVNQVVYIITAVLQMVTG